MEIDIMYDYTNGPVIGKDIFQSALDLVGHYFDDKTLPNPFIAWGDPSEVSSLVVFGTSTQDILQQSKNGHPIYEVIAQTPFKSNDAATVRFGDPANYHSDCVVSFFLLDKIFYKGNEPRQDAFPYLATIMAHEAQNAVNLIEISRLAKKPGDPRFRLDNEIKAYQAGIEFGKWAISLSETEAELKGQFKTIIQHEELVLQNLKRLKNKVSNNRIPHNQIEAQINQAFRVSP